MLYSDQTWSFSVASVSFRVWQRWAVVTGRWELQQMVPSSVHCAGQECWILCPSRLAALVRPGESFHLRCLRFLALKTWHLSGKLPSNNQDLKFLLSGHKGCSGASARSADPGTLLLLCVTSSAHNTKPGFKRPWEKEAFCCNFETLGAAAWEIHHVSLRSLLL